jgi:nuclear cap-binding protein subunit 1
VQALFLSLYKNFSNVLMERLPDPSRARTLRELKSIQADEMTVDLDESSVMEVDNESGRPNKRLLPPLALFLLLPFSFLCFFFFSAFTFHFKSYFVSLDSGSQSNGGKESNIYNVGEKEQWCLSTLGYVKAFARQYASEVNLV